MGTITPKKLYIGFSAIYVIIILIFHLYFRDDHLGLLVVFAAQFTFIVLVFAIAIIASLTLFLIKPELIKHFWIFFGLTVLLSGAQCFYIFAIEAIITNNELYILNGK